MLKMSAENDLIKLCAVSNYGNYFSATLEIRINFFNSILKTKFTFDIMDAMYVQ
jgi:hypothetical protein